MRCLDVGISSMGNIMMGIVAGWFRIVGVANKVNRF
ncbi:putative membrane protein, partial [Chlamydia psittaci 01DC11]